eukprot:7505809-Pyramimonas_sp.AAC.1
MNFIKYYNGSDTRATGFRTAESEPSNLMRAPCTRKSVQKRKEGFWKDFKRNSIDFCTYQLYNSPNLGSTKENHE